MNNRLKNNDKIFDDILSGALLTYAENEIRELNDIPCEHTFSFGFERKITKIAKSISLRKAAKTALKGALKATMSAACVLGVVFMVLMTQPRVYAAVLDAVRDINTDHDEFTFPDNDYSEGSAYLNQNIRLHNLPEEFVLRQIYFSDSDISITYESIYGDDIISFTYGISHSGSLICIDNEHHSYTKLNKNGIEYHCYEKTDDNSDNMLLWVNDGYNFMITAQLPMDELVQMAENVE